MNNSDNLKLLTDERSLMEAEAGLARTEAALGQKADAFEHDDLAPKAAAALARVAALEAAGTNTPELARAKATLKAMSAPPALAQAQRAPAVAARKAALAARDAASRALTAALPAVEQGKAAIRRDVDAIEAYVNKLQAKVNDAIQRRQAQG